MKKFNYFLSIAFTILISTSTLSAFTTAPLTTDNFINVVDVVPNMTKDISAIDAFESVNASFEELQVVSATSSNFIQDNLALLYALCFVLVLINLVAQVKIIFQMVHLFFQFRKKDDTISLNF